MNKLSLPDQISLLVKPLLNSLGLCLWGLEYFPSTARSILRIYIEKNDYFTTDESLTADNPDTKNPDAETSDSGNTDSENVDIENLGSENVGIDECTEASRLIGLTLEVEDLIPSAYVLEVSTPGLDRRFFQPEQLALYVGENVEINLHEAAPGHGLRRKFNGRLTAAQPEAENYRYILEFYGNGASEAASLPDSRLEFTWADVKKAKLLYEPPQKVKPGHKAGARPESKSAAPKTGRKNDKSDSIKKAAGTKKKTSLNGLDGLDGLD